MRTQFVLMLTLALGGLGVPSALAQDKYGIEVGGIGGFSDYLSLDVSNGDSVGEVDPKLGFSAGFILGQNLKNKRFGGEFRYIYFKNNLRLRTAADVAELSAEAHAIHYDLLYYFSDYESKVRPYVAAGFGMKYYRGRGTEDPFQPGTDLVILTRTSETKAAGDFGAGVKWRISPNTLFRVEFRTYVSGVPKNVISPAPGVDLDGTFWQWAPFFGFSWTF